MKKIFYRFPDIDPVAITMEKSERSMKLSINIRNSDILSEIADWCKHSLEYLPKVEIIFQEDLYRDVVQNGAMFYFNDDEEASLFVLKFGSGYA